MEHLHQDRLNRQPHRSGVAVSWQVDEHREEPAVGILADIHPHHPPLLHAEHGHPGLVQVVRGHLEQVVARVGLDEVQQVLAAVRTRVHAGALQNVLLELAQHRNVVHGLGIRGTGVQAQETPFAGHRTIGIEALDAHVVQVGAAVHGGAAVGFGQHKHPGFTGLAAYFCWQLGKRQRQRRGFPHDPQRCARDRGQRFASIEQVVFAVTEEREVVVGEPIDELGRFRHVGCGHGGRRMRAQFGS